MFVAMTTVYDNKRWWREDERFIAFEIITKEDLPFKVGKKIPERVCTITTEKLPNSELHVVRISAFDRQGISFQNVSGGVGLVVEDEQHANEIVDVITKGINFNLNMNEVIKLNKNHKK